MGIRSFEDIEAWQLARELTRDVYALLRNSDFAKDYALKGQICGAAGSAMHNIAEGFDAESNTEFIRFLRYAKRSCSEVQSQLYIARDQNYISEPTFDAVYERARQTRAAIRGFIKYLVKYEKDRGKGVVRETANVQPESLYCEQ